MQSLPTPYSVVRLGATRLDWARYSFDLPELYVKKSDKSTTLPGSVIQPIFFLTFSYLDLPLVFLVQPRRTASELSEIIMEINDLRRVACAPDRPERNRRRFCNRASHH